MLHAMNAPETSEHAPTTHVKETVTTLVISFVLAFILRAFVVEPFIIPTGSMAPTLLGQHLRFTSPDTGYTWATGPQFYRGGDVMQPQPIQGGPDDPVLVTDPMTGQLLEYAQGLRIRSGDRIAVFKYLYSVYDPQRFDAVVFKFPGTPDEAFIKRLLGLPGEMVALVDGDVFTRVARPDDPTVPDGNFWALPGWEIRRKSDLERVQRTVWQPVFDSNYAPRPGSAAAAKFRTPWIVGDDERWSTTDWRRYDYAGNEPTTLAWDDERRPFTDACAYNDNPRPEVSVIQFPVSDVRSKVVIRPRENKAGNGVVACELRARGHEFRAEIRGVNVSLAMAKLPDDKGGELEWRPLASATLDRPIPAGQPTSIDFWHVDQSLELRIDDQLVARGVYDWSPAERILHAFGRPLSDIVEEDAPGPGNYFAQPQRYSHATLQWEFDLGPFRLERTAMWRDLHYQAGKDSNRRTLATHPLTTLTLNQDQFFVCGDNSPISKDGREWQAPESWVAREIDPTIGVVPRALMVGKAFFVYFPSLIREEGKRWPMIDFGRMRFIW